MIKAPYFCKITCNSKRDTWFGRLLYDEGGGWYTEIANLTADSRNALEGKLFGEYTKQIEEKK